MAKTLVIKGADYSSNAFDTVAFDAIPCTGISLDKQAADIMSIGGTTTIVATVTPSNTTDQIVWSSSDSSIATIAGGVVTSVALGTAIITATCGSQSATCVITSRAFMDGETVYKKYGYNLAGSPASTGGNGLPDWRTAYARMGGIASNTGTLHFYGTEVEFPFVMPTGTGRVKITLSSDTQINEVTNVEWFNHNTAATSYPAVVKYIANTTGITLSDNTCIVEVPTVESYPAIDSIAIGFRTPQSTTMVAADLDGVTVEFLLPES